MMRQLFRLLLALVGLVAASPVLATPCEKLTALTIPDVMVERAEVRGAGPFQPPSGAGAATHLPAFCRLQGIARPTADSAIRFEVWLPVGTAWNGKFQGVGNGGYQGSIAYDAMATALKRGYATASTDTGHSGDDLKFGQGHPEKVTDWAWRAIHVTAETAKLIVRNHYGRFPRHSYFVGCSTGGHQALSEAQRFPGDYDGIVAGDPGYDRVHQTAAYLYSWLALHDDAGKPLFVADELKAVTRAAVAACDGLDGIKDGIIADPRRCGFDPARLLCKAEQAGGCLSASQVAALHKVYVGLHNPRTGAPIFPGWSVGSEGFGNGAAEGWGAFLLNPSAPMRSDVYRYFVFHDPDWNYRNFDFDRDVALSDEAIGEMAAVDPDLGAFRARGGKLLMYAGWADPVAAPLDVLQYYDRAAHVAGGYAGLSPFFRFFMVPGMGHCRGGPGYDGFDMLTALEDWAEKGDAPARVIARKAGVGSRPLCPYPQQARWTGKGSTQDAANFVCATRS